MVDERELKNNVNLNKTIEDIEINKRIKEINKDIEWAKNEIKKLEMFIWRKRLELSDVK